MSQQGVLFDDHQLAWQRYDARHPAVFAQIVHLAEREQARGESRVSMKYIFESIRKYAPRIDGEPVALNNNWTAVVTRQVIAERPDLAPLFRTRRRHVA